MTEKSGLLLRLADRANALAGTLIITLMVAQFIIVVLRYVFAYGASWSLDLLVYLFMLASILPLVLVVLKNYSVRVDIFYQGYKPAKKARLDRFGLAVLLLPVAAYTTYISWAPVVNSWKLLEGSPTLGGLPGYFVLKTVLLLVFLGLAVAALVLILRERPWDYDPDEDGGEG